MRYDICVLRVIAILAILLHHAAQYPMQPPTGIDIVPLPIDTVAYHVGTAMKLIGLALFTFISGFLLRMQMSRNIPAGKFALKKAQRILIPAVVLMPVYALLFMGKGYGNPLDYISLTHLWYLPFIFLSLLITYLLRPTFTVGGLAKVVAVMAVCLLLKALRMPYLFGLDTYYPIFVAGYLCKDLKISKIAKWGGYLSLLFLYYAFAIWKAPTPHLYPPMITLFSIIFSILALDVASRYVRRKPGRAVMMLDRQSFHIYLVHQFVINALLLTVTFTGVALKWLPLVFAITLAGSLALCTAYDLLRTGATRLYHHFKTAS